MTRIDRRHALRMRTARSHARLEESVGDLSSLSSYARFVSGFLAWRSAVEPLLLGAMEESGWRPWRPTLLADDLRRDARDLRIETPIETASFASIAAPRTHGAIAGLSYVLEGSSLGAQVVAARVGRLGVTGNFAGRHLMRQIAALQNWRALVQILNEMDDIETDEACDAADRAFAEMALMMAEPTPA